MSEGHEIPAFCTQCRSRCGCKAIVVEGKIQSIEPMAGHPSGEKLCPKGRAVTELVYHKDRLTHPLRRVSPKGSKSSEWEQISWDEAMNEIAGHMNRIRGDHGAEQVAFSVTTPSGTHMSDCISWVERFIRAFGSPNSIYGTEICNWHKDIASKLTYGFDIGTPDFATTNCILLWGHNPAATWLARSVEIQKALRRGVKMIVVDPRHTLYARRADSWLQVRPGTDQALALGLVNLLLQSGQFDRQFAQQWTNGAFLVREDTGAFLRESDLKVNGSSNIHYAASKKAGQLIAYDCESGEWLEDYTQAELFARQDVATLNSEVACRSALQIFADAASEYPAKRVEEITGVAADQIHRAADILAESNSVSYYAWNGVGQSVTATQTDRAIAILYGLMGSYGQAGGNVPGGAASFNDIAGHDLLNEVQGAKALGVTERPLGPGRQGWVTARDVYTAILDKTPYPVRMLFSFGGNLLSAQPDTDRAKQAFQELEFHVHTDFFMNETAKYADIVLPVATSWEREGLRTGFDASLEGMRRVQLRQPVILPIGEARSDTDIALALAKRLGLAKLMFDCDIDKGHAHVLAPSGIALEELKAAPEGITLPSKVQLAAYEKHGFPNPTKRLEIYSETMLKAGQDPVPKLDGNDLPECTNYRFPLRLGSAKHVAFCHSQGRNLASLRKLLPDPVLEISPDTAGQRGIKEDDWVEISTKTGSFVARAKLSSELKPGSVFAQHGWTVSDPQDLPNDVGDPLATNMNQAISTERSDPISGSIPLRCSWCEVRRV